MHINLVAPVGILCMGPLNDYEIVWTQNRDVSHFDSNKNTQAKSQYNYLTGAQEWEAKAQVRCLPDKHVGIVVHVGVAPGVGGMALVRHAQQQRGHGRHHRRGWGCSPGEGRCQTPVPMATASLMTQGWGVLELVVFHSATHTCPLAKKYKAWRLAFISKHSATICHIFKAYQRNKSWWKEDKDKFMNHNVWWLPWKLNKSIHWEQQCRPRVKPSEHVS